MDAFPYSKYKLITGFDFWEGYSVQQGYVIVP